MPTRYHPVLIVLHWLLAFLIIGALIGGSVMLDGTPNSDPAKLGSLRIHMILGLIVGVLMIARLITRLRTAHPPEATSGIALADAFAPWAHVLLYVLAFGMVGSGMALSIMSGLPDAVFGAGSLPESFDGFTARSVHGIVAKLLIALILLHIAAALYHQIIRKDGLMSRLSLRKK